MFKVGDYLESLIDINLFFNRVSNDDEKIKVGEMFKVIEVSDCIERKKELGMSFAGMCLECVEKCLVKLENMEHTDICSYAFRKSRLKKLERILSND